MRKRIFGLIIVVLLIFVTAEVSIGQEEDKTADYGFWKIGLNVGKTQSNLKIHDIRYGQKNGLTLGLTFERIHNEWFNSELRFGYHRRGADISYFFEDSLGDFIHSYAQYDFNSIDLYVSFKFKLLDQDKWNPYLKSHFGFYKGFDVTFTNTIKVNDEEIINGGKVNNTSLMWAGGLSFGFQREFGRITLSPEITWLHDIVYLSSLYKEFGDDLAENQLFMLNVGVSYSLMGDK